MKKITHQSLLFNHMSVLKWNLEVSATNHIEKEKERKVKGY